MFCFIEAVTKQLRACFNSSESMVLKPESINFVYMQEQIKGVFFKWEASSYL